MKLIPLTQGKSASVDDDLFLALSRFKWMAQKTTGGQYYAVRKMPLEPDSKKQVTISMHRQIALGFDPVPYYADPRYKGLRTIHEDGDGLNNQRYNIKVYAASNAASGVEAAPVPPGVNLVLRKKRLPRGMIAVEPTERILYARSFGNLTPGTAVITPMRGYFVATDNGYNGPFKTYHAAVEEYVRLYGSFLSAAAQATNALVRLFRTAVGAGTRVPEPQLTIVAPGDSRTKSFACGDAEIDALLGLGDRGINSDWRCSPSDDGAEDIL